MAGRKRIPTKTKIIRGTFRKDRAPEHEPEPEVVRDLPKPPPNLPSAGKKLWKSLAAELVDKKVLTVVDLGALEVCCYNYGLYRDLHKAIHGRITVARYICIDCEHNFEVLPSPDRIICPHCLSENVSQISVRKRKRTLAEYMEGKNSHTMPEYVQMTKAFATFKAYLVEFGLTPSSRARLDIPEPEPNEEDPVERMWNEA